MRRVGRQPLDRRERFPGRRSHRHRARAHGAIVLQHGARAAHAGAASVLRAGEAQAISEDPQQWHRPVGLDAMWCAVDDDREGSHGRSTIGSYGGRRQIPRAIATCPAPHASSRIRTGAARSDPRPPALCCSRRPAATDRESAVRLFEAQSLGAGVPSAAVSPMHTAVDANEARGRRERRQMSGRMRLAALTAAIAVVAGLARSAAQIVVPPAASLDLQVPVPPMPVRVGGRTASRLRATHHQFRDRRSRVDRR